MGHPTTNPKVKPWRVHRTPNREPSQEIRGSQNFVSEMQGDMTDIVDQHETILTWTPAGMVAVD
jgi:hypothetical protein